MSTRLIIYQWQHQNWWWFSSEKYTSSVNILWVTSIFRILNQHYTPCFACIDQTFWVWSLVMNTFRRIHHDFHSPDIPIMKALNRILPMEPTHMCDSHKVALLISVEHFARILGMVVTFVSFGINAYNWRLIIKIRARHLPTGIVIIQTYRVRMQP